MKRPRHQRPEGHVLSVSEYTSLLGLPPGLRICKCHLPGAELPCAACQAREEWREWSAERGDAVLALFRAGSPVPVDFLPSYFQPESA